MSDRYTPVTQSPLLPVVCNCACQRCLDGDCCMVPDGNTTVTWTTTTIGTGVIGCGPISHDFAERSTGGLFCRKCGQTR